MRLTPGMPRGFNLLTTMSDRYLRQLMLPLFASMAGESVHQKEIILITMNISSALNLTYKALNAYQKKADNCIKRASQRPSHTKQSCNPNITLQKLHLHSHNNHSYINMNFATINTTKTHAHNTHTHAYTHTHACTHTRSNHTVDKVGLLMLNEEGRFQGRFERLRRFVCFIA